MKHIKIKNMIIFIITIDITMVETSWDTLLLQIRVAGNPRA